MPGEVLNERYLVRVCYNVSCYNGDYLVSKILGLCFMGIESYLCAMCWDGHPHLVRVRASVS